MSSLIHIARRRQSLGTFSKEQIREGITSGQFREGDLFWVEGAADWRPLGELTAQWGFENPLLPMLPVLDEVLHDDYHPPGTLPSDGCEPAWVRRKEIGFFPSIFQTLKGVLLSPNATFANLKQSGGVQEPLGYYLVLTGAIFAFFLLLEIILGLSFSMLHQAPAFHSMSSSISSTSLSSPQSHSGLSLHSFSPDQLFLGIAALSTVTILFLIIGLILYLVMLVAGLCAMLFLLAGIHHLCLMLVGGARQSYETTFRVYCYVHGTMSVVLSLLFGLVALMTICMAGFSTYPFSMTEVKGSNFGIAGSLYSIFYCSAIIWALVCFTIGLKNAHRTDTWRAALATLLPILICCGSIIAVSAFLILPLLEGHSGTFSHLPHHS